MLHPRLALRPRRVRRYPAYLAFYRVDGFTVRLSSGHSISWAATVAPRFQQASRSSLLGLPDTTTVSAALDQPSPVVMESIPRSAPSVPSLPCRKTPNGLPLVVSRHG